MYQHRPVPAAELQVEYAPAIGRQGDFDAVSACFLYFIRLYLIYSQTFPRGIVKHIEIACPQVLLKLAVDVYAVGIFYGAVAPHCGQSAGCALAGDSLGFIENNLHSGF